MTNKEAIKCLECDFYNMECCTEEECKCNEAITMAIEALEKKEDMERTFEWCDDCKEYDKDKHCCHRWTKVIRNTCEEHKAYYEVELLDKIERIVYDHTDNVNYNVIMREIYELYDLDWSDEE